MDNNKSDYGVNDIQVLEGLEAVRKRPGMYIGTTGERGLVHLVWEIVDNAVDEALAGYCDDIEITINKDNSITVEDDGRGIPTGIHPKTGKSTVETVFTVLHAGGKFGGGGYKVSGGLHGVGASVVNALSTSLEVTVYQNGKIHYQKYENGGHPVADLKVIGDCEENRTGTKITFKPDPTIFEETTVYNFDTLKTRARELAFLNKGLQIKLIDLREEDKKEAFLYNGGIIEYVQMLNASKNKIHEEIIYVEGKEDDIEIEVAMQYNDSYTDNIYSFTNNIHTVEGGTHEDGVRNALSRIINNYARKTNLLKEKDENLATDDIKEGITMIISCKHGDPQFEGQTKTKLGNIEVRKIANNVFGAGFERYLMENPDAARAIVEKIISASKARVAARKARELARGKKDGIDLPAFHGKLTGCSSKKAEECEVFIVEGDSAAGTAKDGRDPATQAILPIRGKILNVEKARLHRILDNEEIRTMITAFNTGIGEDFDITKLRYHKIIIMTDADVDGAHIRILLLTLFYRYFKPLIENGHIYAAQPPLYSIKYGKNIKYVLDDNELEEFLKTLPENTKPEIGRMKGLGEMDAHELKETTMHIGTRVLKKITMEDAISADATFELLMGEDVEPRRKFIEENARYVTNLDV